MNLALITQDFPPETGGIQTYSIELANRLVSKCKNFIVIAPDKPSALQFDRSLPYPVHRIPTKNALLGLKAIPGIPSIFQHYNIKKVFHSQWQTLPLSIFSRNLGVANNIYIAAHCRELLFNPFYHYPLARSGYNLYMQRLLAEVDLFFPVSAYTGSILRQLGVEDKKIKVVINGTDPEKFYPINTDYARKSIGIRREKVLLSVSRLVSRKGIDTALKAFKRVLKDHPNSLYVIVGSGPEEAYLKELAVDLNIKSSIIFAGSVSYENLINYYNACNVFVLPSKTEPPDIEGFGIVFLEANACGKPVIGTFSGGIPSAVIDGKTGILVKERDPQALSEAINTIFDNPDIATKMGKKGRRRVEDEANWDALNKQLSEEMISTI